MIIKNAFVYGEDRKFHKGDICIAGECIRDEDSCDGRKIDAEGLYAIPGLIDLHFHGAAGYDFCDGTAEALEKIGAYELQCGITAMAPASMTYPKERLAEIFENAAAYKKHTPAHSSELVGINMEGPFISMEKKGAQNPEYITIPDAEMFFSLQKQAEGLIKLLDLAPEEDGAMEAIERLKGFVRISVAHTTADYDTAMKAFHAGARQVTHLYNAMPPFGHRDPGVIGAACDAEEVMAELICDGIHIHPSVVRATFKMFGRERIILISDSMMATGLKDGAYTLGGLDVTVKGKKAILTNGGAIAGSVTNLMDCMRTAVQMQIPLEDAVGAATMNPAMALNLYEERGSIREGKFADILLLDSGLNLVQVIKKGRCIYE